MLCTLSVGVLLILSMLHDVYQLKINYGEAEGQQFEIAVLIILYYNYYCVYIHNYNNIIIIIIIIMIEIS